MTTRPRITVAETPQALAAAALMIVETARDAAASRGRFLVDEALLSAVSCGPGRSSRDAR